MSPLSPVSPGYCCHLLAGSNPAPVLSPATAPRPGDLSVTTPLSCIPLSVTQGSVAPCMAPGWDPKVPPKPPCCKLKDGRLQNQSWCPARELSIVSFELVDAGTGSGPWLAAALLVLVSPGRVQLCFSEADAESPTSHCSPVPWVSPGCGVLPSPVLAGTGVHTPSLFPRLPCPPQHSQHLRSPGTSQPWGCAGDNHGGPSLCQVRGHPWPPCTSPSSSCEHQHPENGLGGCYTASAFQLHLGSGVKVWRRQIHEPMSPQRPRKRHRPSWGRWQRCPAPLWKHPSPWAGVEPQLSPV